MKRVTRMEIDRLLELFHAGDDRAGEQLLLKLRPMVLGLVRRFTYTYHDADDLEQVGYMGLLKAIERFDPALGVKLTTYAVKWIMGEIRMYLRRGHNLLRGPSAGKASSLSALAAVKGVSPEEAAIESEYPRPVFPGTEQLAQMPSDEVLEEEYVRKTWLKEALLTLSPTERKIIFYRYFKEKSQQEVASLLGYSQKQVSRLEIKVLQRMKETMKEDI
ncbi:MAG: sigma-70 family RNA polymerase sigma factor [Firmicutes bacterium]|nr:sigma-70 family RNA polymerase sigma factor [Bacillota bacterium]